MTPVSSVANTVTAKPPDAPAGDARSGEGQAAFIDALLALIADIAGLPEATEATPAADAEMDSDLPQEAMDGAPNADIGARAQGAPGVTETETPVGPEADTAVPTEKAAKPAPPDDRPEIRWATLAAVPVPAALIPASDAPPSPIVEPPAPAEGVPDTGRSATPPTAASPAPDLPPASRAEPSGDAPDVAAPTAATGTDDPASRGGRSADTPDAGAPATATDTDNPAHRRVEGTRDDREPVAGVTTSARSEHRAPPAVEAETIAAIRAELAIPASDKRGTALPAPVITGRIADAPMAVAAPDKNEGDTATPEPDDAATTGKVSLAQFAEPDADTAPGTLSAGDAHDTATPSHAASRSAIATHDATAAAAAQSGATQAATGPTSHAPTTVVAVPVTAEQLAEVVSQEVVRATPKGEHRLEITLHPPELGRVEVNMVVGRDSVQAHLVAHTEGARDLLTHHLTDLREQLVAQGFADPRLSVDLRHGSGERGGYRADRRSDSPAREDREVAPVPGPARMPEPRDRHALHLIA